MVNNSACLLLPGFGFGVLEIRIEMRFDMARERSTVVLSSMIDE